MGHAGWIGIDLRRRLGSGVPGLVVVDWVVSEAPAALLTTLEDVRSDADRDDAVAGLLQQWQAGVPDPAIAALLADMGAVSDAMWDRAAREIESSYARFGSPLRALAGLEHPPPVLHLVPAAEGAFVVRASAGLRGRAPLVPRGGTAGALAPPAARSAASRRPTRSSGSRGASEADRPSAAPPDAGTRRRSEGHRPLPRPLHLAEQQQVGAAAARAQHHAGVGRVHSLGTTNSSVHTVHASSTRAFISSPHPRVPCGLVYATGEKAA